MSYVEYYRDLDVYQSAHYLAKVVFDLTLEFPREERYSLTDQIRRSSRSIGAQVAEAWGKRRYEKYFVSKLSDAVGELFETQHWIETSATCNYLSKETAVDLIEKYELLNKRINAMINKSGTFCY